MSQAHATSVTPKTLPRLLSRTRDTDWLTQFSTATRSSSSPSSTSRGRRRAARTALPPRLAPPLLRRFYTRWIVWLIIFDGCFYLFGFFGLALWFLAMSKQASGLATAEARLLAETPTASRHDGYRRFKAAWAPPACSLFAAQLWAWRVPGAGNWGKRRGAMMRAISLVVVILPNKREDELGFPPIIVDPVPVSLETCNWSLNSIAFRRTQFHSLTVPLPGPSRSISTPSNPPTREGRPFVAEHPERGSGPAAAESRASLGAIAAAHPHLPNSGTG